MSICERKKNERIFSDAVDISLTSVREIKVEHIHFVIL